MAPIPKNLIEPPDIDFETEIEPYNDYHHYHIRQKEITTKYNILINLIKTLVLVIIYILT